MEYVMWNFFDASVERYCELAQVPRDRLRAVDTPFIDEQSACAVAGAELSVSGG